MSSYVVQFFCGPEGIALANPGGTRARPALSAPPPRATAELVFEEPLRPVARLRPASEYHERPRSPSRHRRAHERDRRDHRHHRRQRSASGHRRRHRSRTPHQPVNRRPAASQPAARRPTASPPGERPPGQWMPQPPPPRPSPCIQQQAPAQRPQPPTPAPPGMFTLLLQCFHIDLRLCNISRMGRHHLPTIIGECHAPNREGRHVRSRSKVLVVIERTPPKRAPAKPPRHHEPKASPPHEPEPPAQVQATALVAKGQQPVEAMFKDVMIASQSDLESQIEALLPGSDPDVHVKDGLTLFTQYVFFRLQYWYNKYPTRWPIANHECLQSIQARRSFTRKWMRQFSSLRNLKLTDVRGFCFQDLSRQNSLPAALAVKNTLRWSMPCCKAS